MTEQRVTLSDLPRGIYDHSQHSKLSDRAMRRYHPFAFDFDSTPFSLEDPKPSWDEEAVKRHLESRERVIDGLRMEYGARRIAQIVEDVRELGPKPFSFIAHHNRLADQARRAFIGGAYFPALVSACALGERMLNHMILDLREDYTASPYYRKVRGRKSFDNWSFAVEVLNDWKVLIDGVGDDFLSLAALRNRSIHFNLETYRTLREDALIALKTLFRIASTQFGWFGRQPWFIDGTAGAQFIKRDWESHPFVRTYIVPLSGFVGTNYGMDFTPPGIWHHLDYDDYGDGELDDEAFAKAFAQRDPEKTVTREMIDANSNVT